MNPTKNSEAKHTPGPWERTSAIDNSSDIHVCTVDRHGNPNALIATVSSMISFNPATGESEECKANARLIASAPELAECLAVLLDEIDRLGAKVSSELELMARAAIAKATGGSQ